MAATLKDEIREWVEEYPSLANHGWTGNEFEQLTDALWEFLSEKIGPVQEKLLNDVEIARQRATQAERNEERAVNDLARYIRDHSGN